LLKAVFLDFTDCFELKAYNCFLGFTDSFELKAYSCFFRFYWQL